LRIKYSSSNFGERYDRQNAYKTNSNSINIETLFPSPEVIIKDLFDLYKANKPRVKRNTALINYLQLLFQKCN